MKKLFILFFCLLIPLCLVAKYRYDETVYIPISQEELNFWKIGYQNATETGMSSTRYILKSEDMGHWTQLLNIQFKDKSVAGFTTVTEAVTYEASQSLGVTYQIYSQNPNDLIYERSFPTGEHEIVRMIMTNKGLHRVAYVKQGSFEEFERNHWIAILSSSVVGGKQNKPS